MLKVLLVEDENLIRRGLQYKMDWTEVNCVVVRRLRRFPINLPLASLRAYLSGKPCIRPPRHPPTEREKIRVGLYG